MKTRQSQQQPKGISLSGLIITVTFMVLVAAPETWIADLLSIEEPMLANLYGGFASAASSILLGDVNTNSVFQSLIQSYFASDTLGGLPETALASWFVSRPYVWFAEVSMLIQHVAVALLWFLVFSPAGLISIINGMRQRNLNHGDFYFASPLKIRRAMSMFKLLMLAVFISVIVPVSAAPMLIPLVIGVFCCFCGHPIGKLPREL